MKTFKHSVSTGRCVFLELPLINRDVDALALAANFLMDLAALIPGKLGIAKLNPKDKHYVKSIGREVAQQKAVETYFNVVHVQRNMSDKFTSITLKEKDSQHYVTILVKRGSRVRVEI